MTRIATVKIQMWAEMELPDPDFSSEDVWEADLNRLHDMRDMAREILAYRRMEMDHHLENTRNTI